MLKVNWFCIILISFPLFLLAQDPSDCYAGHSEFLENQESDFADPEHSPLKEVDLKRFKRLNYFDYDESYCVQASWVRTPGEKPFEMATSTERMPVYVKYGELHFSINGQDLVLAVYQNPSLTEDEEYKDYLFLPFNDLTNGVTTYGGGRYIDFRIPDSGEVQLDLNNSYHPYCAYNYRYSCPIPPEENMLNVAIEAGVRSGINGESEMEH